jgi:hypothetical protein
MNDIRFFALTFLLSCTLSAFAQVDGAKRVPPAPVANPAAIPDPNPDSNLIDAQDNNNVPAIAQVPSTPAPSSNGNLPISPRSPQTPPVVDAASKADAPSPVIANISAEQTFTTLDRGHKGYLETKDVASNKYLAGHFEQCDSNHDGRLQQAEVKACLKPPPPEMQ